MRLHRTTVAVAVLAGLLHPASPARTKGNRMDALFLSTQDVVDALDLGRPGLEKVAAAVAVRDLDGAAAAWAAYMRQRVTPTLHFGRDTWPGFLRAEFPQLVRPIVAAADRVAAHELGHGPYRMPVKDGVIQWLENPGKDTNYVSVVGSSWLLNPLGRAYLLTGDERYAATFVWFFDSWFDNRADIETHQGGLGFSPMYRAYYPGIRARILIDNYYCLASSDALTPASHMKLMRELLGAARWVHARNRRYVRGNQQVAAVLGPALTGLFFPEFRAAQTWVDQAATRMREHLARDFFPDGGHKELCTQYHKTVLRDVGYVGLTQRRNGLPSLLEGESGALLSRAYDWLAALVMPTGVTPPLHSAVFANDYTVHLAIGARFMGRGDYWWLAKQGWDNAIVPSQKGAVAQAVYMINEDLAGPALASVSPTAPAYRSVHLRESGFAVMRSDWTEAARYLVFQYGWANTGHAYPGALSFLLAMNGEVVATHPGSPRSYRLPSYGYCHSTRSHNVLSVDNASYKAESGYAPGGELLHLADLDGAWYVKSRHEGYKPRFGAVHERVILALTTGPILWHDRVLGGTGHTARWHFHTPLGVALADDRYVTLTGKGHYRLCPAWPDRITAVEQERRWMAVLPQDCQPADCGKWVSALAFVQPVSGDGAEFAMALIEGDAGRIDAAEACTFSVAAGSDRYLVGFSPTVTGAVRTDAGCWCIRFAGDEAVEAWVIRGKVLVVNGTPWLNATEVGDTYVTRP